MPRGPRLGKTGYLHPTPRGDIALAGGVIEGTRREEVHRTRPKLARVPLHESPCGPVPAKGVERTADNHGVIALEALHMARRAQVNGEALHPQQAGHHLGQLFGPPRFEP